MTGIEPALAGDRIRRVAALTLTIHLRDVPRTPPCSPPQKQKCLVTRPRDPCHRHPFPNLLNSSRDIEGVVSLVFVTHPYVGFCPLPDTSPQHSSRPCTSWDFFVFRGFLWDLWDKRGWGASELKTRNLFTNLQFPTSNLQPVVPKLLGLSMLIPFDRHQNWRVIPRRLLANLVTSAVAHSPVTGITAAARWKA